MGMEQNWFIRTVIGLEYLYQKDGIEEESKRVHEAFRIINEINESLFEKIPYEVIFTLDDPYQSAAHMRREVQKTNKIYILASDESKGYSGHPCLTHYHNNIGRAVHDVWAHCVCGCPFTFEGEYTAYLEQRKHYPKEVWDVLFAEIPAQTAAYYANEQSHSFQQRGIAAPQKWMNIAKRLELPNYSNYSILKSLLDTAI